MVNTLLIVSDRWTVAFHTTTVKYKTTRKQNHLPCKNTEYKHLSAMYRPPYEQCLEQLHNPSFLSPLFLLWLHLLLFLFLSIKNVKSHLSCKSHKILSIFTWKVDTSYVSHKLLSIIVIPLILPLLAHRTRAISTSNSWPITTKIPPFLDQSGVKLKRTVSWQMHVFPRFPPDACFISTWWLGALLYLPR